VWCPTILEECSSCVLQPSLCSRLKRRKMTPDEVERMKKLCQQIEVEKDHHNFSELIAELNELLEQKNKRLDHPPTPAAPKP
jgi:hypothetical protein